MLPAFLKSREVIKDHIQVLLGYGFIDIRTHFQILLHRHFQENPTALRHMGKTGPEQLVGLCMGDILVAEGDTAISGVHQAGNGFKNRTFSGAVGTNQGYDFPLSYLKRNILDGVNGAVIYIDVFNFKHGPRPPLYQDRLQ